MTAPAAALAAAADRSFWEWVAALAGRYGSMFLAGAGTTLLIALSGTIVGFLIGLLIGVVRTVPRDPGAPWPARALRRAFDFVLVAYIEVFRGTPMIVQAMVVFYGMAQAFGIRMPTLLAGFIIVSINTGAYMAEIVRGGILSIDKGQFEAAHSIGMTHGRTMAHIVLPQAVRNILPALGNEFVINIKDTSVLNVISVTELFFETKSVAGTSYRTFETFFIASVLYFVMTFTVTRILRLVERRMEGKSTYTIHGSMTTPESEIRIREDA